MKKVKDYLKQCHEEVIAPALAENGLSWECYYEYLREVYCALPADAGVRRKFSQLLDESREAVWQEIAFKSEGHYDFAGVYVRDNAVIDRLLKLAEQNKDDEELSAVMQAQKRFASLWLARQKRYINREISAVSTFLFGKDVVNPDSVMGRMMTSYNALSEVLNKL